ncbi:sugar ABC transporter permease [Spirochaetia bacterium]|nr:sugar ABC transporter permease [Spirochaetia bacterium]GHU93358.1 sugar ABC transporter permease [Spirochaetia bacterium]
MTPRQNAIIRQGRAAFGYTLLYIVLIAAGITMIFPFIWMISTSLKQGSSVFVYPPQLLPIPPAWRNYADIFVKQPMLIALLNSLKIAIINTAGTLFTASMAAYGFAKIHFRFKNQLFMILLATMMIPGQVTLIPIYVWFRKFGWVDTHYPLIVPAILCNAYGVFMLRQFFMTIPDSYSESAKIDGASQLVIFFRIMLPLCIPAMATLGLFSFMGNWNSFMGPLIYLNSKLKYTIPLMIRFFQNSYYSDWGLLMAASCVSIMPIIILYIFSQRYFIQGVVMSGLKG